jgi:hypothetical protein
MKAYKHLVKYSLAAGHTVSVWDGEVWEVKLSTDYKTIIDCIESVEEAEILIFGKDDTRMAWALVSAYGLADDETVVDCTISDYTDGWQAAYDNETAA